MSTSVKQPATGPERTEPIPEIPVTVRRAPGHTPHVVGVMPSRVLVERYKVPRFDYTRKVGYQRPVSAGRVNKLVSDLMHDNVDLPTAVLLNIRNFQEGVHLIEQAGQWFFRPADDLYVVDGQHRVLALEKVIERAPDKWGDFPIAFVCMMGGDELKEMTEFYVVNSTAKSVRTDLAYDLLKQRAESDPSLMQALLEKGEDWKVEGQTITEELCQASPYWRGRVRFAGAPIGETVISSSGMVSAIKPLLSTPYFEAISRTNKVKILVAYWQGIQTVLPEAFNETSDYVLQKFTGAHVMHRLLITVIEILRANGRSVIEADSYFDVMREPLLNLQGENRHGHPISGADFWRVGATGAAGAFSNNAGRRVLTARLKNQLPSLDIE